MDRVAAQGSRFRMEFAQGAIAGWRWRKEGAPRLVFCHANGFCASAYRRMLGLVADRFDIVAPDLRGHGRTSLPANPDHHKSWGVFGADLARLLDVLSTEDGGPVVLAGHSLGAVAVTLAARGREDIAQLLLIEPVATPPETRLLARTPLWPLLAARSPMVRGALSRRAVWPDRAAVIASYEGKRLFARWEAGRLEDYLDDGVTETASGVTLSCAPEWERVNDATQRQHFWAAVTSRPCLMRVLAAEGADTTVSLGARRRLERAGAAVEVCKDAGHLLPMERPAAAAEFLLAGART